MELSSENTREDLKPEQAYSRYTVLWFQRNISRSTSGRRQARTAETLKFTNNANFKLFFKLRSITVYEDILIRVVGQNPGVQLPTGIKRQGSKDDRLAAYIAEVKNLHSTMAKSVTHSCS